MQSSSCRLIVTIAVFFIGLALSQNDLSSSNFENCQQDATVKVNHAFVRFDRAKGTVTFEVSGTSTEEQTVKASLVVLAYGVQVYQRKFDPCDSTTNVPQLCPGKFFLSEERTGLTSQVPMGTFAAKGNQTVPAQYLSQIPAIAYSIPDLEGNATLTLVSAKDGSQVGCIQSGISNGKTLEMPQVANAAMGVAASALALSGVSGLASAGLMGGSPSTVGFGTVVGWFQTIAVTGMMSVNYPPIYRSFSKNFAFSTGLVSWQPMQANIDAFRNRTGGNLDQDNTQFLHNATLTFSDGQSSNISILRRTFGNSAAPGIVHARDFSLTSNNETNTTSDNSQTAHIVHGIGAFAEELMIPQGNVFM